MGKMFSLWLLDVDKSAPPSATSSDDDTNEKEAASAAASGELALNMSSDAVDSTATSPSPNISTVVVPALSNAEDAPEEKNEVVTNPLSIPVVVGTPLAGSATSSSSTSNEDSFTMIDQADADTEEVHLVVEPEAPPVVTPPHQAAPASACAQEQPQEYPRPYRMRRNGDRANRTNPSRLMLLRMMCLHRLASAPTFAPPYSTSSATT